MSRRRVFAARRAWPALIALTLLLWPSAAHAAVDTWTEGTSIRPFAPSSSDTVVLEQGGLRLPWSVLWSYSSPAGSFTPRSIQCVDANTFLAALGESQKVVEISRSGRSERVVCSSTTLGSPLRPWSARRIATGPLAGGTLVVDRQGDKSTSRVFVIDGAGTIVWQYGVPGQPSAAPGHVVDPFSATTLPNGDTLICEGKQGSRRVIRVRSSDYAAGAPDLGYGAGSILWEYGTSQAGPDFDPRYASPVGSNVLITDATNHRIIEVDPSGAVVWSYNGTERPGGRALVSPSCAERLPDGRTVITDEDNGSAVVVNPDKTLADEYRPPTGGAFTSPRGVSVTPSGGFIVADQGNARLMEIGRAASGTMTSADRTFGATGRKKRILSFKWAADTPPGTSVSLLYSLDGGAWTEAGTSGSKALRSGTTATRVAYRVVLASSQRDRTPTLTSLSIGYDLDTTSGTGAKAGTGTGSGHGTGSGSGGGSGSGSGSGSGTGTSASLPTSGTGDAVILGDGPSGTTILRGRVMATSGGGSGGEGAGGPGSALRNTSSGATAAGLLLLGVVYLFGVAWTPIARVAGIPWRALRSA